MENRFERRLSKVLVLFIIILFLLTIVTRFVDEWILSLIWFLLFIASWVLMLVYSFDVLLNKKARGFSILTAIVTTLAFATLSIHALQALARFVRFLPTTIIVGSEFFIKNNQLIFYSSLLVVYFFHMVNAIALRPKDKSTIKKTNESKLSEEEIRNIRDSKLNQIIEEVDSSNAKDGLSDEDRQILNSHLLKDSKRSKEDKESEIKIYE